MLRAWGILLVAGLGGCEEAEVPAEVLPVMGFELTGAAATDREVELAAVRAVDGEEALGVYPLPARIPVAADGRGREIRLEALVRRAGVASNLAIYPMYEAALVRVAAQLGEAEAVVPELAYAASVEEVLRDDLDFGVSALVVDVDGDGATALTLVRDGGADAFARGELTEAAPILEVASVVLAPGLPAAAIRELWLELDYRGTVPIQVAILPEDLGAEPERGPRYLQGVFGREGFARFYFDLRGDLSDALIAGGRFRVGLLAAYDADGPAVQRLEIDNLRLLAR